MTVELFNLSTIKTKTLRGVNVDQLRRLEKLLPMFRGEWVVVKISDYL